MKELTEHDKQLIIDSVPDADLVGFWPGLQGRGNTLIDRSKYGNHATFTGAQFVRLPRGLVAVKTNSSLGYGIIANNASLNFTSSPFTIMAWVKVNDFHSSNYEFFAGYTYANSGYNWLLYDGGYIVFLTHGSGNLQQSNTDANGVTVGSWQHIVVTRSGASAKLYNNAVDLTTNRGTHINPASYGGAYYLCSESGMPPVADMQFTLLTAYKRALTQTEIARVITRQRRWLEV